MEKLFDALIEELAKRVMAKLAEDTDKMMEAFKVKRDIEVDDVIGLENYVSTISEEVTERVLRSGSFSVEFSA